MSHHKRPDLSQVLTRSLSRLLGVFTFGLLGSIRGYNSKSARSSRYEFIVDYALVSLYLAMIFSGAYRILLYFDLISDFHYYVRSLIYIAMLAPSIYILFLGQIRRLNDIGFYRILILLNFIPMYGLFCFTVFLAITPRIVRKLK